MVRRSAGALCRGGIQRPVGVRETAIPLPLDGSGRVEFYWDYDDYYVGNPDYEAGLFLRENIRNFPSPSGERFSCDRFRRPKRIEIVSAPSDSMQCKYVHEFLSGLIERGIRPGKQTAIVLTDESLLLPVLYSIPEQIEQVNVDTARRLLGK